MAKRNIRISDKYALRFTNYSVMDAEEILGKYISDVFEDLRVKKLSIKQMVVLFRAAILHQFDEDEGISLKKASQIMDEFEFPFVMKKLSEALKEYMNPKGEGDKEKNVKTTALEKE